jgi:hypothetical protein
MKMMPPQRENSSEESSVAMSSPVEDLVLALHELLRLQQCNTPSTMQLDTCFQLSNFVRKMNGKTVDSWICSLSTYFKTSPKMEESTKLQIASMQHEGIAQAWWDSQLEQSELVMDLSTPQYTTIGCITSWDAFFHALRERFYPPGYLQNLLTKWFQLRHLSNQCVQGYIDVFYKLHIYLCNNYPDEVLIIKFNSGILLPLRHKVDLFERSYLDKVFLRAFTIERKVSPQIFYPPN